MLLDEARVRLRDLAFDGGVFFGLDILRVIDLAVLQHFAQHDALTLFGAVEVLERVETRRLLRQTGQKRRLRNAQIGG